MHENKNELGKTTMDIDRKAAASTMESLHQSRILAGVLAWTSLFLLALTSACAPDAQADGAPDEGGYTRIINVEVETLRTGPFSETISLTGTVQANRDVIVSAEESGVVREIVVDKGRWVETGQALFKLDDELLQAQVAQARALANMARETWERRKRLWEEDRVGSELVYLEAKYASEQAAANLDLLEVRLERTTIRSPIPGIMDSREVEVGSMVGAGTPVARVVSTNPVKITAGVPERYAMDVRPGAKATVSFDVLPGESFDGTISYVGSVVNPRNRTFPLEFKLRNPGGLIKPEMVADVSVIRRELGEVVVIPQEALVRVEDGYVVFLIRDSGGDTVAMARPVELGPAQDNRVVVLDGLSSDDRLIVVGQQSLASGDRVNVVAER